VADHR